MTNSKISELYDSGYISGEAFLYCVENNLYTVQDIIDSGVLEEPSMPYGEEFSSWAKAVDVSIRATEKDDNISEERDETKETGSCQYADIEAIYYSALATVDVRTIHALEKMQSRYENFSAYITAFTQNDAVFWNTFKRLPAVGKKSIERAQDFVVYLKSKVSEPIAQDDIKSVQELSEDKKREIDSLEAFFYSKLRSLSTRSYNAMNELYEACGKSLATFYLEISSSSFDIKKIHNVGKKSAKELECRLLDLKGFIEHYLGNGLTEEQSKRIGQYKLQLLGIKGELTDVQRLHEGLGYFPYFAAIQSYFTSLTEREQLIIKYQLDFFESKDLCGLKEASKLLGLTSERTRQLRAGAFELIQDYIKSLSNLFSVYPLPDLYFSFDVKSINALENTNFNGDFVRWVVSIFAPDRYVLLGNIEDAFYNPYGKELPLVIIPHKYNDVFKFKAFIKYLSDINDEKRVDDIDINITNCVLGYFKDRIYYEYLDDIIRECKSIVNILFNFEITNEVVHIKKNSQRNNPELAELILRDIGHSMTLDEIYTIFQKRYPNRTKSVNGLAGALRLNPNIACVGRSSTYTLTEWNHGEHRGGTIREFAAEYLLSQSPSIATLENIGNYVRQFRPTSSDKSIHANLLLEGAFAIFYKENVRYIGFANQEYPEEYRRFSHTTDAKRDFKSSCTLLEQFVAQNGRMPFSCNVDEDEKRLSRFWNVQLAKLEKGLLGEEERCIVEQMQTKFKKFKIEKKEFDWLQNYNNITEHFENGGKYSELSFILQKWLNRQMANLRYNKAPVCKIDLLTKLANIINNAQ